MLNQQGIYVVRVRDTGLPRLESFDGITFFHGKPPQGEHTNEIITKIIHVLKGFAPPEKKTKMNEFHLSYDEYLEQKPRIEALLFTEKKKITLHHAPPMLIGTFRKIKN